MALHDISRMSASGILCNENYSSSCLFVGAGGGRRMSFVCCGQAKDDQDEDAERETIASVSIPHAPVSLCIYLKDNPAKFRR